MPISYSMSAFFTIWTKFLAPSHSIWIRFFALLLLTFAISCKRTNVEVNALGSLFFSSSSGPGVATIASPPNSFTNSTAGSYTVGGVNVVEYKFKFGLDASTTCSDSTGYSSATVISTDLSVSGLTPDGLYKICLIGKNSEDTWQSLSSATEYSFTVDTTLPTATLVSSTVADGIFFTMSANSIPIQVTYSEPTLVNGTPTLSLNSGGSAYYSSGSGSSVLTFIYNTSSGESATDLDVSSINLNGGTIVDVAGNVPPLVVPMSTNPSSLKTQKDIQILSSMSLTVAPVYSGNANWMDYVQYSNSSNGIYGQSDTACLGTETGPIGKFNGCIHGGELKKVVVTDVSSCANLTLIESLNAFDWECTSTSGTAVFYTRKLKKDFKLKDLIDSGLNDWRNNSVTVQLSGTTIGTSPSTKWWTNTFASLPSNPNTGGLTFSDVVSLSTPGTIYTTTTDRSTIGYTISADKIAIVTLESKKLIWNNISASNCSLTATPSSTGNKYLICGGSSRKFIWLEIDISGDVSNQPDGAINMEGWTFSQIRHSSFKNFNQLSVYPSLSMKYANSNKMNSIRIYKTGKYGVQLYTSKYNFIESLEIENTKASSNSAALQIGTTSQFNTFVDTKIAYVHGLGQGIQVSGSSTYNNFIRSHVSNVFAGPSRGGIDFTGGGYNKVIQSIVVGTGNTGLFFSSSSANIVMSSTSTNHTFNGIYLINSNNNYFQGSLIGNTPNDEALSTVTSNNNKFDKTAISNPYTSIARVSLHDAGTSNQLSSYLITDLNFCAAYGNVDATCTQSGGSTYRRDTVNFLTSSFVGNTSTKDTKNTNTLFYNTNKVALLNITDWMNFDNFFRSWGNFGVDAFDWSHYTPCQTTDCQVWDWSIKSSDPFLLSRVFDGTTAIDFTNTLNNGACPATGPFSGNDSAAVTNTNHTGYYMLHAIEMMDTGGNDNGLCESGESCVFAPNIGAYQGHDSISSNYCTTSGAYVNGTKIYQYTSNGYP